MITLDLKQGSTEWNQARLGVLTASEADAILTPTFKARDGQGVETYLFKKLSEKVLGYAVEMGGSFHTDQGHVVETIARPWFAFTYDKNVRTAGFCTTDDGRCGCSPDGLLDDGSGMEIKSPSGPVHLKYYFGNALPAEHAVQVHFSMWVTGAPYWTFVSYHRELPPLVVRVDRDEKKMAAIQETAEAFLERLGTAYDKIKSYRDEENRVKTEAYQKVIEQELAKKANR